MGKNPDILVLKAGYKNHNGSVDWKNFNLLSWLLSYRFQCGGTECIALN